MFYFDFEKKKNETQAEVFDTFLNFCFQFLKRTNGHLGTHITFNHCTQMVIRFSGDMKIESKTYNIAISIYSKIEKKKI